jgi:hypothetical protein
LDIDCQLLFAANSKYYDRITLSDCFSAAISVPSSRRFPYVWPALTGGALTYCDTNSEQVSDACSEGARFLLKQLVLGQQLLMRPAMLCGSAVG